MSVGVVGICREDREREKDKRKKEREKEGIGFGSGSGSSFHRYCIRGVYDLVIVMCERAQRIHLGK